MNGQTNKFETVCIYMKTLTAQETTIKVSSPTRNMQVYIPVELPKERPLMISLHGMNLDPAYKTGQPKWEKVADTAKFVVVYPWKLNTSWIISGTSDLDFMGEINTCTMALKNSSLAVNKVTINSRRFFI